MKKKTTKGQTAKKTLTRKVAKKPARTKPASKDTANKAATKKSAPTKTAKKAATKKRASKKTAKKAATKKPASKKTAKKAATKKPASKKTAKKATTKKAAPTKTTKKAATKKPASKKTAKKAKTGAKLRVVEKVEPAEPGLPLKEIRARLGLIGPQIGQLEWLEGLYLYGSKLLELPRLEQVDFIVVYRGLRNAARLKASEAELQELLAAVLPLDFDLKLTGTLEIGRLLREGNPAAQALLGYAEPVFTRGG